MFEFSLAAITENCSKAVMDFSRFSQLSRMINAIAYFLRLIHIWKSFRKAQLGARRKISINELIKLVPPLTLKEIKDNKNLIYREEQRMNPPDEATNASLNIL